MATSEMPVTFDISSDDLLRKIAKVEVSFFDGDAREVRQITIHHRNGEMQIFDGHGGHTYAARCASCQKRHWAECWCACPQCGKSHHKQDKCD